MTAGSPDQPAWCAWLHPIAPHLPLSAAIACYPDPCTTWNFATSILTGQALRSRTASLDMHSFDIRSLERFTAMRAGEGPFFRVCQWPLVGAPQPKWIFVHTSSQMPRQMLRPRKSSVADITLSVVSVQALLYCKHSHA